MCRWPGEPTQGGFKDLSSLQQSSLGQVSRVPQSLFGPKAAALKRRVCVVAWALASLIPVALHRLLLCDLLLRHFSDLWVQCVPNCLASRPEGG